MRGERDNYVLEIAPELARKHFFPDFIHIKMVQVQGILTFYHR